MISIIVNKCSWIKYNTIHFHIMSTLLQSDFFYYMPEMGVRESNPPKKQKEQNSFVNKQNASPHSRNI